MDKKQRKSSCWETVEIAGQNNELLMLDTDKFLGQSGLN